MDLLVGARGFAENIKGEDAIPVALYVYAQHVDKYIFLFGQIDVGVQGVGVNEESGLC